MAIDANILLQGRVPDATSAVARGFDLGQQVRQAPMRNRLLDAQVQGAEQQLTQEQAKFQIQDMATDAIQVKKLLEADPTGQQANVFLAQRIKKIQDRGGDPSDTMAARDMLNSGNVQGFMAELEAPIQAATQLGLIGGVNGQQGARIGQYNPGDYTPESWSQFVKNPSDPSVLKRYETSAKERLYTSPDLADRAAEVEGNIAASKAGKSEAAKLKEQFKLKPEVAAAVESAVSDVKAQAEASKENRTNERALSVYDTAMSNLTKSLGGTVTGPVSGWLPAMTANSQIAEGAMAVMTPVLKSIFRTAGEGTFTDKDQELLQSMVPTRKDLPEARTAKVAAIDAIVRAKLGQGVNQQTQPPAESVDPALLEFMTPEERALFE